MKKFKLLTIVGTRPEIIRLSRVMSFIDSCQEFEHITVHTGQNYDYELNQVFYDDLQIKKPKYFLNAAGATSIETIGKILINIDPILISEKPDAVLILGDTNSCLCAIAAKKRKIPIFHMEAGNRCFDQRVPEETNRKIVDHIADINLTYSSISKTYLEREGIPPDRIIKTGSPMFEVLNYYKDNIENSDIIKNLDLKASEYFLVSAHREENINTINFIDLIDSLNTICEEFKYPVIISTHPRTKNKLEELQKTENLQINPLIRWLKPLGFFDYNHLQMNARAVLSDSGTISEESSILNFRALNIRESHERPEAMEEASVMMVGLKKERIIQALSLLETQTVGDKRNFHVVKDYSKSNVSIKVSRLIISYTDFIKREVWKMY